MRPCPSRGASAVPKRSGSAATSSTGTPSIVTPTARRLAAPEQRDDLRQRGKAREHGTGLRRDADHRQQLGGVAPAAHVARDRAAERLRNAADELQSAIQQ